MTAIMSDQEWTAALAHAGGPVPITEHGVTEAVRRGTIARRTPGGPLELHDELLPAWPRADLDELLRLAVAYQEGRRHGSRLQVKRNPRLLALIYHAVNVMGISDVEALAELAGDLPEAWKASWLASARLQYYVNEGGRTHVEITEAVTADGFVIGAKAAYDMMYREALKARRAEADA